MNFALILDVDGVLYKDFKPIPGAIKTLQELSRLKIPHLFVTNSGGLTERQKCDQYQEIFNISIQERQVILAHTPMKMLTHKKDKKILLIGAKKESSIEIMKSYGYTNLVYIDDFIESHQYLFPYRYRGIEPKLFDEEAFDSIFVIRCPVDWQSCLQACIDLLMSDGRLGHSSDRQVVDIHFSNPDFGLYHEPRLTEGSFRETLAHLYKRVSKRELVCHLFGKPVEATYKYAKTVLDEISKENGTKIERFYAIGDNPESDILGANLQKWYSILVQTGLYKENYEEIKADVVCRDIGVAYEHILELERVDLKQ